MSRPAGQVAPAAAVQVAPAAAVQVAPAAAVQVAPAAAPAVAAPAAALPVVAPPVEEKDPPEDSRVEILRQENERLQRQVQRFASRLLEHEPDLDPCFGLDEDDDLEDHPLDEEILQDFFASLMNL